MLNVTIFEINAKWNMPKPYRIGQVDSVKKRWEFWAFLIDQVDQNETSHETFS
jgi:hypothetical protein